MIWLILILIKLFKLYSYFYGHAKVNPDKSITNGFVINAAGWDYTSRNTKKRKEQCHTIPIQNYHSNPLAMGFTQSLN